MQRPRTAADRPDNHARQRGDAADRRDKVADKRDRHALDRDDLADHRDRLSRDYTDDIVARIHDVRGQLDDHLKRLEQSETDPQRRNLIARDRSTFSDLSPISSSSLRAPANSGGPASTTAAWPHAIEKPQRTTAPAPRRTDANRSRRPLTVSHRTRANQPDPAMTHDQS